MARVFTVPIAVWLLLRTAILRLLYFTLNESFFCVLKHAVLLLFGSRHVACAVAWQGYIVTLKEGYGFIRCTDRDARMFFHFSELLDLDREIHVQQEVEFTVVQVSISAV